MNLYNFYVGLRIKPIIIYERTQVENFYLQYVSLTRAKYVYSCQNIKQVFE